MEQPVDGDGIQARSLSPFALTARQLRARPTAVRPARSYAVHVPTVGPTTGALTRLTVGGVLTIAVAVGLLGHEVSAAGAMVLAWWALLFCSGPSGATDRSVATPPNLARPALTLLLLASVTTWLPNVRSTPTELVLLAATTIGASALVEVTSRSWARLSHSGTTRSARLVVVGSTAQVQSVAAELGRSKTARWQVVAACVSDDAVTEARPELPTAPASWAAEVAGEQGADGVLVLPTSGLSALELRRLSWQLERDGRHFLLDTGLLDVARHRTALLREGGLDVVHVRPAARRGPGPVAKAVLDRIAAAVLLVLLAPLLLAVALTIRLDSAGPALFTQTRIGRYGRPFTIYKFRTMTTDAETAKQRLTGVNESDGVLFKIRSDPRITRVGGVLRKYSVDELPQLWNVVCGQMSLVGPRPALADEVDHYTVDPRRRLDVKPGLTGLWQVTGRSDLSWEETVRRDLEYVDNWSIGLDLVILWRTIGAVVSHRGAY